MANSSQYAEVYERMQAHLANHNSVESNFKLGDWQLRFFQDICKRIENRKRLSARQWNCAVENCDKVDGWIRKRAAREQEASLISDKEFEELLQKAKIVAQYDRSLAIVEAAKSVFESARPGTAFTIQNHGYWKILRKKLADGSVSKRDVNSLNKYVENKYSQRALRAHNDPAVFQLGQLVQLRSFCFRRYHVGHSQLMGISGTDMPMKDLISYAYIDYVNSISQLAVDAVIEPRNLLDINESIKGFYNEPRAEKKLVGIVLEIDPFANPNKRGESRLYRVMFGSHFIILDEKFLKKA